MNDSSEKSIRVIPFNWEKAEYRSWSKKFLASATMKQIKPALIGGITDPLHDENLNSLTDKKKIVARAMNEKAYNELIHAM